MDSSAKTKWKMVARAAAPRIAIAVAGVQLARRAIERRRNPPFESDLDRWVFRRK